MSIIIESISKRKREESGVQLKNFIRVYKSLMHPVTLIFIITLGIIISISALNNISLEDTLNAWGSGLKNNFNYAMQFMLLLLIGYTLAITPIYTNFINKISGVFTNEKSAIIGIVLFSTIMSQFNWALGIVGGVILAHSISLGHLREGKTSNSPLLVASGLSGLVISESGISGNIVLYMANPPSEFSAISVTDSVFSTLNIVATLAIMAVLIVVLLLFSGKDDCREIPKPIKKSGNVINKPSCLAEVMETNQLVSIFFGLIGLFYIFLHFYHNGVMDLKTYLLLLIVTGIILRKEPLSYQADVSLASSYAWIFFFPLIFSGAIQGMFLMNNTSGYISQFLSFITTKWTFAPINLILSGLGHFFIPNTGAQWLIDGRGVLSAGQGFNLSPVTSMLSFCYGAGVAKLLNIFIILPIISLVDIKFISVLKYLLSMAAASATVFLVVLLVLG